MDEKSVTKLFVEVKTYGMNSFNFQNLVEGFDQAIKTAGTLKGYKTNYSVLAVDADAYMNAIKDPANRGILLEKLRELNLAGSHMKLLNRQNKNAERDLNKTVAEIKDDNN